MKRNKAVFLIFLCWLVYTVSYFGKVNYSANITQIINFYGVSKPEAGLAPTFFFFSYGIGQVINGLFCKRYNIKWMVFLSLAVSSIINVTIAVSDNFAIIKWLWLVNGFVLSILWPTIIRFLSENLQIEFLSKSSIVMGTTVATGTLVIYLLSSLYAALGNFKLAFYTASFAVMLVAFFWLIFYDRIVNDKGRPENVSTAKESVLEESKRKVQQKGKQKYLINITIFVLCFFAVGVNLIKDGLTTWVPTILKEEYNITDALSILLSLLLPIIAVFGNLFAVTVHKKIPDYVTQCFVCFAVIGVVICGVIWGLSLKLIVIMLAGLVIANFFASSLNSVITSIFPMFMREKVNSGKIAGVINGFCYLGSTISSYGLGSIAENFGWSTVFYVLLGFCLLVAVIWCGYILAKKWLLGEDI